MAHKSAVCSVFNADDYAVLDITILPNTPAPFGHRGHVAGDRRQCLAKRERNDDDAKSRLVERNEAHGIGAGMGCVASPANWREDLEPVLALCRKRRRCVLEIVKPSSY